MKKEIRHCFSLNRCEKIINLYRNLELLKEKAAIHCDNACLEFFGLIKKDIYDITIPELNEYQKIVELRRRNKKNKLMS